ncbi:MAG: GFA family protein [Pseudomonadales bacterium]|nr:GFA family protein [Pseudomonadales bacterium]
MKDMKKGGCHCGAIGYEYRGKPICCYACHCTDCQTVTGSACTISIWVMVDEVQVVRGNVSVSYYT